jgi:MFS family permease
MQNRVLRRLMCAQALSSAGTSISMVALVIMVGKLTGSALHMGGVLAVTTFPLIVTSWVGGAMLDRFSAKKVMIVADLARAAAIISMPFLAEARVGLIYAVACLMGIFTALFNPGQMKLTSELVGREELIKANSYLSVSRDGAELLGYLAGGALVAAVGYKLSFGIDSASYLLSAVLLLWLPRAPARTEARAPVRQLVAESPRVFLRLWRDPGLRTNLLLAVFPLMFMMMVLPVSYGLVLGDLDAGGFQAGGWAIGALEASIAAGLIIGGLMISRMKLKQDKNSYVVLSLVLMAATLVGIRFSTHLWMAIALMGVGGMANVGTFVPSITMFQEAPGGSEKGRLLAVRGGFGQVGSTTGFLLGGFVGEWLGIRSSFLVAGVAIMAVSLVIYVPYRVGVARRARAAVVAAGAGALGAQAEDTSIG